MKHDRLLRNDRLPVLLIEGHDHAGLRRFVARDVDAVAAVHTVVTDAAVEPVFARAADQDVVAAVAVKGIVAVALCAVHDPAATAPERVAALATEESVVAFQALQGMRDEQLLTPFGGDYIET